LQAVARGLGWLQYGQQQLDRNCPTPQQQHNAEIALQRELHNNQHALELALLYNREAVQDNTRIATPHHHQLAGPPQARYQGEIRPYRPNVFGRIENFLNSPNSWYMWLTPMPAVKFVGRIGYGIANDAWITAQSFTIGRSNARHLNRSAVIGHEALNAGLSTLKTFAAPFGSINKLRQSGLGVVNGAQFNSYHKTLGTGLNSAQRGGLHIRQHNFLERDVIQFENINKTFNRVSWIGMQLKKDLENEVE